ncbi:MAG: FUSC family protein [Candidatus Protistobacter heckmanni]|nr:FUSC family protein [Candidatus Protistobacter heckmanni]
MLTIAVIMRSSFSLTRQRRLDRIMGNVAGCILTAVLLHFHPPQLAVLGVLFMAIAHTFATIQYRYASTAACVMALLQLHFISPGQLRHRRAPARHPGGRGAGLRLQLSLPELGAHEPAAADRRAAARQ